MDLAIRESLGTYPEVLSQNHSRLTCGNELPFFLKFSKDKQRGQLVNEAGKTTEVALRVSVGRYGLCEGCMSWMSFLFIGFNTFIVTFLKIIPPQSLVGEPYRIA